MSALLGPVTYEMTPVKPANQHELAQLFPMLDNDARARLVDDIRENGVLDPVVFLDGLILDGRNRYYVARELGVEYPRADYIGNDPLAFVISRNLHRRHLTDRQRADVAAKMAKLPKGRPSAENPPIGGITVAKAAEMMEVPVRAVERAKAVQEHAAPELLAAYEAGAVSPSAAAEVASLPVEQQAEIVAKGDDEIIAQAAAIKQRRKEARQAEKAEAAKRAAGVQAGLPAEVRQQIARTEEFRAQAKAEKSRPSSEADALRAELEEKNEYIASLEAEVADLKRQVARYDEMAVQYEQGGFDKVIAGKDEVIRGLETRLYSESADKASWMHLAKAKDKSIAYYKAEAEKRGYSDDIDLDRVDPETGEVMP